MSLTLPPTNQPIAGGSRVDPYWERWLGALVRAVNSAGSSAPAPAPEPVSFVIDGSGSIAADGSVSSGAFSVSLENDKDNPPLNSFYGADTTGTKGFVPVYDALEEGTGIALLDSGYVIVDTVGTPDDLPLTGNAGEAVRVTESAPGIYAWDGAAFTLDPAATGIVNVALAPLADAGTGTTLKKIVRDAYGRLSATATANAVDLPYSNATSGLTATNTQAAIDQVVSAASAPVVTSLTVEPDGTSTYGYTLKGRQVSGLAVGYITPETSNTRCVWDVFPKGTPTNFTATTGVAWFDLCSTDIEADGTNYECLRMGIFAGGDAHIGHMKGGTGTQRNLRLQIAGGNVGVGVGSPPYLLTISGDTIPALCVQDTGVDKFFFGQATAAGNWFTGSADGDHCIRGMGGKLHIGSNASTPTPAITINAGSGARTDFNSDSLRITTAKTPASATATGTQGQVAWDSSFIYVCVAANTWRRAAIAAW